ncbi:profilin-1-like [Scleropages formosus]|uniref:Profilin n=1 Tax=Scleropages formosus TaxID=113540 RepID=A0A8C9SD93_SCLFO|nr:profilin-1-like [Scleropages formosus]XP_018588777.1 profilin-1-like [Scleropages formosus]
MSWDSYIDSLMAEGDVEDAAIVGCESGQESVWAASKGGLFATITQAETRALVSKDRSGLFAGGCTIAGMKCTVLRDALNSDGQNTMDIRTKASDKMPDTYCICVGKSHKGLVFLRGRKDTHGGKLNSKIFPIIEHLRKSGY